MPLAVAYFDHHYQSYEFHLTLLAPPLRPPQRQELHLIAAHEVRPRWQIRRSWRSTRHRHTRGDITNMTYAVQGIASRPLRARYNEPGGLTCEWTQTIDPLVVNLLPVHRDRFLAIYYSVICCRVRRHVYHTDTTTPSHHLEFLPIGEINSPFLELNSTVAVRTPQ
eukprot:6472328-Amphidinium_carterae.1